MKQHNNDLNRETRRAINRYFRSKRCSNPKTKKKKMQYLEYLREYLELIGKSIKQINYKDLEGFVEFMNKKTFRGNPLAPTTKLSAFNEIYYFFDFFSHIPGYKRVINYEIVEFFKLSKTEKKKLRGEVKKIKYYPTLDQIHKILESIPSDTLLGRRLTALIIYLFLTGSRIESAATMRLGLVDLVSRMVRQDPAKGVKTKFGKYIETTIPLFDEDLYQILVEWINDLKLTGARIDSPLFPAAKNTKEKGSIQYGKSIAYSERFMDPKSLNKLVKEACRNAELEDFHCHSFRDSHIYYGLKYARNYIELKAVSLNVGHKSVETTLHHYSDLAPEEVHNIISKLGDTNNNSDIPSDLINKFKQFLKVYNADEYRIFYGKGDPNEL